MNDLCRFMLEPVLTQIFTRQRTEFVDYGLITVIEQCVSMEKRLVLAVTSGGTELSEGPLMYSTAKLWITSFAGLTATF